MERIEEKNQEVFIQISESFVGRAIRTDKFLYCIHAPNKNPWETKNSKEYEELYLYDIKKDPLELNNLINDVNYVEEKEKLSILLRKNIKKYENMECTIIKK